MSSNYMNTKALVSENNKNRRNSVTYLRDTRQSINKDMTHNTLRSATACWNGRWVVQGSLLE